jgi:tetratricopeptide (TPR) repeat protein
MNNGLVFGLVVLAGLLFTAPSALAQSPVSPEEAMAVGNQNYEAGQYREAIDVYETILSAGLNDSAVYYNLGNAYFKQGELGPAILNYRRAQLLSPRDGDIAANLAVARSQTLDQLEFGDEGLITDIVQIAEEWLTLNEALILATILWLLICFFAIVAILSRRRLRTVSTWAMVILGVFLIVGLVSAANRYYVGQTSPAAVVVAREIDVTSGPGTGDQYLVEFNLHSGAEVRLLESRPGWRRISLPGDEFQGWVPEESLSEVMLDN